MKFLWYVLTCLNENQDGQEGDDPECRVDEVNRQIRLTLRPGVNFYEPAAEKIMRKSMIRVKMCTYVCTYLCVWLYGAMKSNIFRL
jgi:hypothetical protein